MALESTQEPSVAMRQLIHLRTKSITGAVQQDDHDRLQSLLTSRLCGYDDMGAAISLASRKGCVGCVQILLSSKALVDVHDYAGFTPLILASKFGHTDVVQTLVAARCRLNKSTFKVRATALHWAATNNHEEIVEVLLKAGATVETQTVNGRTPLMLAARSGNNGIVEAIIAAGANVNKTDLTWASCLHCAAEEGCTDTVALLLQHGAKINAETKFGKTPVMLASKNGHADTVALLLEKGCTLLPRRSHTPSALHWACEGGSLECARLLLDHDVSPNLTTRTVYYAGQFIINAKVTPIMLAARSGVAPLVELLVARGAMVDAVDQEGLTPMLYAIKMDNDLVVSSLLSLGADPDGVAAPFVPLPEDVEEMGETPGEEESDGTMGWLSPLFLAVKYNCLKSLKVLLRANCNLSIYGYYDSRELVTPFELALYKGHLPAAKMLVIAGFSFEMVDPDAFKELYLKIFNDHEDLPYLMSCSSNVPRPLLYLTRACVRRAIGYRASSAISSLPLPSPLQRFLDLDELDRIAPF